MLALGAGTLFPLHLARALGSPAVCPLCLDLVSLGTGHIWPHSVGPLLIVHTITHRILLKYVYRCHREPCLRLPSLSLWTREDNHAIVVVTSFLILVWDNSLALFLASGVAELLSLMTLWSCKLNQAWWNQCGGSMCPRFSAHMQQSRRATMIKAPLPVLCSWMSSQLMTFSRRSPGLLTVWFCVIADLACPIRAWMLLVLVKFLPLDYCTLNRPLCPPCRCFVEMCVFVCHQSHVLQMEP